MVVSSKENILIVDDEEMIRWVLRRKLSKEGYKCDDSGGQQYRAHQLAN